MVKYRQPIVPHDRGADVLATKIGMRKMGHYVSLTNREAGLSWEHTLRVIQHHHGERVDGIYGPKTHSIIARHFTERANYLYLHAKLRHRSAYVNPFSKAYIIVGRCDEGMDYHGKGPILALGDLVVYGVGGAGWPDGHYLNFRLTSGRHAGRFWYLAEGIVPRVRAGQRVKAGEPVADFRWDAAPNMYPGIETGWGSSITNLTWAAVTHRTGPPPFSNTPPGIAFARFLHSIGAPTQNFGPGAEFV